MNTRTSVNSNFFRPGTWVQIQNNRIRFKIIGVAAWSDTDPRVPTNYDVLASNGKQHVMVPVERISPCSSYPHSGIFTKSLATDSLYKSSVLESRTHCWSCKAGLNTHKDAICAKCAGLLCACGGCRCNWPYATDSTALKNSHHSIAR
jgi:hypothetical protein